MKPTIIIAILALKLYVGHKRFDSRIAEIIEIYKDNMRLKYG